MTVDSQQHTNNCTRDSVHLFPCDFDLVDKIVNREDEDGTGGVEGVNDVDGKVEETLREDETVEYH